MKKIGADTMCGNKFSPVTQKSFVKYFLPIFSTDPMNNKHHTKFKAYAISWSLWGIVYDQGVIDTGSQKPIYHWIDDY